MKVATRVSLRQLAAKLAQEFAIAVTLCTIAIVSAGGVTDSSMRVGLLVAAIYLMAAEIYRQMPELARHATAPLRRLLVARAEAHDAERSSDSSDASELRGAIEALTAAAHDFRQVYTDAAQTLARTTGELSHAANALAASHDYVSENADRILNLLMSEWRRAIDGHDQMIAHVIQEMLSVREDLLRDAVVKLDRIASQLEALAISSAPPDATPNNPTPITRINFDMAAQRAMAQAFSVFLEQTEAQHRGIELAYEDSQREARPIHRVSLLVKDPWRTLEFYRELGLREAALFGSVRSDPEMLRRLLDVLAARIEQLR